MFICLRADVVLFIGWIVSLSLLALCSLWVCNCLWVVLLLFVLCLIVNSVVLTEVSVLAFSC